MTLPKIENVLNKLSPLLQANYFCGFCFMMYSSFKKNLETSLCTTGFYLDNMHLILTLS